MTTERQTVSQGGSLLFATTVRLTAIMLVLAGFAAMIALTRSAAVPVECSELTVFAGAGMTDVLTELGPQFTAESGIRVRLNFAASSTLARQIAAGAPADVFLSANSSWMDYLVERNRIAVDSRFDLLGNRLVLIVPRGRGFALSIAPQFDLAEAFEGCLALGNPDHVPAGIYARQALEKLGWYESLKPRLAPCASVRAALAMVELGEAPVGVVYATDVVASRKVELLGVFPQKTHQPIRFPIARCRGAPATADEFIAFLRTPDAASVFDHHGFTVLDAAARKRVDPAHSPGKPGR